MTRIALIGDYNPEVIAHRAIPEALRLTSAEGAWNNAEGTWIPTDSITAAASQLEPFSGIWCVPASPYRNMNGALDAIRFARTTGRPFLGTCGGFQHAVIEYARNVRGISHAAHAETDPNAQLPLVAPLACALVGQTAEIAIIADGHLRRAYGSDQIAEEYHCSYGLNPAFETMVLDNDLRATARDAAGEVRAIELTSHPFFVATLFQPERRALKGLIPLLVSALIDACTHRE